MTTTTTRMVFGKDLRMGALVRVWWGVESVGGTRPYLGPLPELRGAQIVRFGRHEMTVLPNDSFECAA